ncbi:hypothetical protein POL68_18335 [Stigmatella sp. ncwal1]|uniref:Alkyl hydroperoxide reductase subunit C/ Thiol specific antioxidant domain-containing protein n=1 Tax=Stigmatella ashevillensis TaxID=2995309 RepID=A0ABT5D9T5_9BACT|nr:hypothetical protein [Stigmatella ashevillena]MDC0710442.1 hypothetical protein [Stigmatella ashevillena]
MKTWLTTALAVTLVTGGARAQQPSGAMDASLRNSEGSPVRLSRWRGKPVILFYEDKDSVNLNAPLKERLFELARERGLQESAWVVAVANLEKFNFFPARQIALSYVKDEEKKAGVPILVDLEGTLGKAPWKLPMKTSTVMLLDAEGTLLYRYSGRMAEKDIELFIALLARLVGVDLETEARI